MKIKNPYTEGDPNSEIFMDGVMAERERLRSILAKYHENFGTGTIEESDATMKIVHMYNFVVEKRQP